MSQMNELEQRIYNVLCSHLESLYSFPEDYIEYNPDAYQCKVESSGGEVFIDKDKFDGKPYTIQFQNVINAIKESR